MQPANVAGFVKDKHAGASATKLPQHESSRKLRAASNKYLPSHNKVLLIPL